MKLLSVIVNSGEVYIVSAIEYVKAKERLDTFVVLSDENGNKYLSIMTPISRNEIIAYEPYAMDGVVWNVFN